MYKSLGASKPKDVNKIAKCNMVWFWFVLWCFMPLSTIVQLFRGGQFFLMEQTYLFMN